MASTNPEKKLSGVLSSLSQTLAEFQAESAEIESQFFELVDGIAEFGPLTAAEDPAAKAAALAEAEAAALESIAVEHLETLDKSIAEQRQEFAGRQEKLSDDVGQLRELVDRQSQLFAAWISSTTKLNKANSTRKGKRKNTSEDEVLNEVFAQFEELRGAAAAGTEVSAT